MNIVVKGNPMQKECLLERDTHLEWTLVVGGVSVMQPGQSIHLSGLPRMDRETLQ